MDTEVGKIAGLLQSQGEGETPLQKKMGEILSCSQRVYSNYERGELDIPTEILIKLAKYYEVSVDYILGITDNPKREV